MSLYFLLVFYMIFLCFCCNFLSCRIEFSCLIQALDCPRLLFSIFCVVLSLEIMIPKCLNWSVLLIVIFSLISRGSLVSFSVVKYLTNLIYVLSQWIIVLKNMLEIATKFLPVNLRINIYFINVAGS